MGKQVEELKRRVASEALPLGQALGMSATEFEPGRVTFAIDVGPVHANPMGTVHGGVLTTLADSAMGIALASTLEDGETFTTVELKINFLRAVRSGRLSATGTIRQAGRTIALTTCDVVDGEGRLVAHATATNMILRGERAEGRRVGEIFEREDAA